LKEFAEKIPAEKKATIEAALVKLKEAHAIRDGNAIDTAMTEINAAWEAASQDLYNASQQGSQENPNAAANDSNPSASADTVTDVEFEEVKDEKK